MSEVMNNIGGRDQLKVHSPFEILQIGISDALEDPKLARMYVLSVAKLAQQGLVKPVQIGNTLFLMQHYNSQSQMLPQGTAEVHVFSTESILNVIKRVQAFPNTARQLGYKVLTTFTTDPSIARIMSKYMSEDGGLKPNMKQTMMPVNGKMEPAYYVEVTL